MLSTCKLWKTSCALWIAAKLHQAEISSGMLSCVVTGTVNRSVTECSTPLIFANSATISAHTGHNAAVSVKTAMATWLSRLNAPNNHLTAMPGLLLVTSALDMTAAFKLFNTKFGCVQSL